MQFSMKVTRAQVEAMMDAMNVHGDSEVEFFAEGTHYAASDPEAAKVGQSTGLHPQGIYMKAA